MCPNPIVVMDQSDQGAVLDLVPHAHPKEMDFFVSYDMAMNSDSGPAASKKKFSPKKLIDHLKKCIRKSKREEDQVDASIDSIVRSCTPVPTSMGKKRGSWPSTGCKEDDDLWQAYVDGLDLLCDNEGVARIPHGKLLKFTGRLSAPGMLSLHYPPECPDEDDPEDLDCTLNPDNPCIYNMLMKLGFEPGPSSTKLLDYVVMTEYFFAKTPLSARDVDGKEPYRAVYPSEIVDYLIQGQKDLVSRSGYSVRLLFGSISVMDDIREAGKDSDTRLFSLSKRKLYQQNFHGSINLRTNQIHLYEYHPESILRRRLDSDQVELADLVMNTFCALLGIESVRPDYFENFKALDFKSRTDWAALSQQAGTLSTTIYMLRHENKEDMKFRMDDIPQNIQKYIRAEERERGLSLDTDPAGSSIIRQVHRHMIMKTEGTMHTIIAMLRLENLGHDWFSMDEIPRIVKNYITRQEQDKGLVLIPDHSEQSLIRQLHRHMLSKNTGWFATMLKMHKRESVEGIKFSMGDMSPKLREHIEEQEREHGLVLDMESTAPSIIRQLYLRWSNNRFGDLLPGQVSERSDQSKAKNCLECGRWFANEDKLHNHMILHSERFPYRCSESGCLWAFQDHDELVTHNLVHSGELPYECSEKGCDQKFGLPHELETHRIYHRKTNRFLCRETSCLHTSFTIEGFLQHGDDDHADRPFVCQQPQCFLRFKTEYATTLHAKEHAPKPQKASSTKPKKEKKYICTEPGCNSTFGQSKDLEIHKGIHLRKTIACSQSGLGCIVRFETVEQMEKHQIVHKMHICPQCGYAFETREQLTSHALDHIKGKKRKFDAVDPPRVEKRPRGDPTRPRPFVCARPGCNKAYLSQNNLDTHIKKKHYEGPKPYSCPHTGCTKTFADAGNLASHALVHTDVRPFVCPQPGCMKTQKTEMAWKIHARTHQSSSDRVRHACKFPGCGKDYAEASGLICHVRRKSHETQD